MSSSSCSAATRRCRREHGNARLQRRERSDLVSIAGRLGGLLLWPMLRKEFIQMRRDRLTLGMLVGIPAIQLAMFGFAIRTEVRNLPTVVLDESRTSHSRALVASMANTRNFAIVGRVSSRAELESKLR